MTTATAEMVRPASERRSWTKLLAPLGGLGIVAGLLALFLTPAGEDTGETPAEVAAYAASHEGWTIAVALFALLSIPLGGAFVAGLHTRLRGIATDTESTLILIGGVVFILSFALCWTIWTAPLVDLPEDPARAVAQAEAYLAIDDISWFLLGAAGIGAALMAVPASLASLRTELPGWVGWLGVAAGIASLATIAFFGIFAWMAWIAGASIVLLLTRPGD
jgi:MFS family permease